MDSSKELSNTPHTAITFTGLKLRHKQQRACGNLPGKKEQGSEYRLTDLALKYVFDKQVTSGILCSKQSNLQLNNNVPIKTNLKSN